MPSNVNNPAEPCPEEKEPKDPDKYWAKFKIVDNDDNKPIEDVVLDLELPGDNYAILETDEKGEVEIKNIKSGSCKLNSDWRQLIKQGITIEHMLLI